MKEIFLCGRPNACCPKIKKAENIHDEYIIIDDYGGEVYISKEQFEILKKTNLDELDE